MYNSLVIFINFFMKFFTVFFSFLILLSSFSIHAEKINEIKFNGLNTISRGTVHSYLPLETGDEFNNEVAEKVINALYDTDFFFDISLNFSRNILTLTFVENPTIKYFDFKGYENDKVINDDVVEKIKQNYGLLPGKIYSKKNIEKLVQEIKNLYESNAFYESKFEIKSDLDEKNRVGIELIFTEGERALIGDIQISGNSKFATEELLDLMKIGPPDFFIINYFTEKDKFSRTEFNNSLQVIKSKYLSEGYLDFRYEKANILINEKTNKLDISIELNEGVQYKLSSIEFNGNFLNFSENELRSFFDIDDAEIFKRKTIVMGINNLTNAYKNLGYAFANIESSLVFDKHSSGLKVIVNIAPQAIVYINRIEISGNHTTQDDVIRRQMTINENQTYSSSEISESINKIKRLGYFSDVKYEVKKISSQDDKVNVLINVVETKTGEISIGLSHSNSTGAAINAGISQNNILGTGNTLKANFSNSDAIKETSIYFEDPYFNKENHSISYGFFTKTLDASNIDTSSYIFDESGLSFGYGIPTDESSRLAAEYKLSFLDLTCGSELITYESEQCLSGDDLDSSISLKFVSNTLNDFYFPSKGSKTTLSYNLGLPFADFQYHKIDTSYKKYAPILGDKTFKFASQFNLITSYASDKVPFFKRYFGGGSSSVRGFDFNSLGTKYLNGKPKGGEFSMLTTIALGSNVDIIGIDNKNMRISGFLDAGTVSEKFEDFKVKDIRSSVGAQFTWLTPIGPIGFNFAQPILKNADDATETFSFELGTSF